MRWIWILVLLLGAAQAQGFCESKSGYLADGRPTVGFAAASLEPFDRVMFRLLLKYQMPGAALAVAHNGQLVLAKGYGWANQERHQPIEPGSRFRLASLSKPITAVAVLHLGEQLVNEGKYKNLEAFLSTKALPLISLKPLGGQLGDPRLAQITVRDLLQHSGGWNRNWAGDPLYRPTLSALARIANRPETLSGRELLEVLFSRKLQFAPGSYSVYSNAGYLLLGQVIEALSGQSYTDYVKSMLASMGIYTIEAGKTSAKAALPGEVHYYDFPGAPLAKSMLDGSQVQRPYGEFYLESQSPNAGLVASAPDLVRFVSVLEGQRPQSSPLGPHALEAMLARPNLKQYLGTPHYYALGWGVRLPNTELDALKKAVQNGGSNPAKSQKLNPSVINRRMQQLGVMGLEWSHDGALAGTRTLLLRLPDGTVVAALFNSRPWRDWAFIAELRKSLVNAAKAVGHWPEYDCFAP